MPAHTNIYFQLIFVTLAAAILLLYILLMGFHVIHLHYNFFHSPAIIVQIHMLYSLGVSQKYCFFLLFEKCKELMANWAGRTKKKKTTRTSTFAVIVLLSFVVRIADIRNKRNEKKKCRRISEVVKKKKKIHSERKQRQQKLWSECLLLSLACS